MSKKLPEWIQDAKQRGAALIDLEDRKQYETQGSILWHEHGLDLVTKIENQAEEIERLRAGLPDPKKLRMLAAWFDKEQSLGRWDGEAGLVEVQDDLRIWADAAEAAGGDDATD